MGNNQGCCARLLLVLGDFLVSVRDGLNLLVDVGLGNIWKLNIERNVTSLSFSTSSSVVFIRKSLDLLVNIRNSLYCLILRSWSWMNQGEEGEKNLGKFCKFDNAISSLVGLTKIFIVWMVRKHCD